MLVQKCMQAVWGRHSFLEPAGFLMPLGSFILHINTEHLVPARHEGKHKRLSLSDVVCMLWWGRQRRYINIVISWDVL